MIEEEERSGGERTYGERAWGVARHGPAPAAVECRALLHEDTHDTATPERLRVHLALNLQRIQREQHLSHPTISKQEQEKIPPTTHHLANARQAARGRLHHHLALALAKRVREAALVVLHDEVVEVRLPAELVHALRDLVARRVSEPREQRHQPPAQRRRGVLAEDDG